MSAKTVAELMKPNKRGVAYFSNLSDPAQLSARDYFNVRIKENSKAKPYTICSEWNNWIEALKNCDNNQWRLAAEQAPKITAAIIKEWNKPVQIRCYPHLRWRMSHKVKPPDLWYLRQHARQYGPHHQ
ncbi:hypothetical protein BGX20_001316 [Mortierella sp. AD010]|nr:hypothetical protein BGX20_001316 [Mortierella sp. AD010]